VKDDDEGNTVCCLISSSFEGLLLLMHLNNYIQLLLREELFPGKEEYNASETWIDKNEDWC
jgi:hypothetical protein